MIALLSKLEIILPIKVKNSVIVLLLLAFGVFFEVSSANKKVFSANYSSIMHHAPESPDFPLSIPFSTGEESPSIGDDFLGRR